MNLLLGSKITVLLRNDVTYGTIITLERYNVTISLKCGNLALAKYENIWSEGSVMIASICPSDSTYPGTIVRIQRKEGTERYGLVISYADGGANIRVAGNGAIWFVSHAMMYTLNSVEQEVHDIFDSFENINYSHENQVPAKPLYKKVKKN
jgi:hypothetical protein